MPSQPSESRREQAEERLIENLNSERTGAALLRMVDFKIPLIWLLGGFVVAISASINMYYQLQEVTRALAALTITVNAGNNQSVTLAGEIALLKFRVEHLESDAVRARPGR